MSEKPRPQPRRLRWGTLAALVAAPLLFVSVYHNTIINNTFSTFSTFNTAASPFFAAEPLESEHTSHTTQYTVQYLDIDEEEYGRLGLTPNKPLHFVPLGNDHKPKTLHGRFLHITDVHPDEFYQEGTSIDEAACHRGKPEKGEQGASKYGDAALGCDTPMVLMNETIRWIKENLRDKIDFVIWTGDNIRHDNDRKIPRTEMAILDMNQRVADAFHDLFHGGDSEDPRHYDVPVVPSLGNNDVYPHNLFAPGPTLQTREMWLIWQNFVPQEQMHIFERGVYYFNEVIPNKLAVLSINTLYLFKANPLVDSCDSRKDPGYELLKWLGVTLQELRDRGMKVWLSGHVPPIPKNFDISCYRKFAIWLHEYRDIIVGGVYGHMNVDHFLPADAQKAYKSLEQSMLANGFDVDADFAKVFAIEDDDMDLEAQYMNMGFNVSEHDLNVAIAAKEARAMGGAPTTKEAYMELVRETFYADIKSAKNSGQHYDRYAVTNVAASIIPTFNPGMRVWEYNITSLEDLYSFDRKPWGEFFKELDAKMIADRDLDDEDEDTVIEMGRKKKTKPKKPKEDPSLPQPMPKDLPLGPAYTLQTFSPLRFTQYYLDLKAVNEGTKKFGYEVEYTSDGAPYKMDSLLVKDYMKLGTKFGAPLKASSESNVDADSKKSISKLEKLWETYKEHAFVSCGYHDPEQDE